MTLTKARRKEWGNEESSHPQGGIKLGSIPEESRSSENLGEDVGTMGGVVAHCESGLEVGSHRQQRMRQRWEGRAGMDFKEMIRREL